MAKLYLQLLHLRFHQKGNQGLDLSFFHCCKVLRTEHRILHYKHFNKKHSKGTNNPTTPACSLAIPLHFWASDHQPHAWNQKPLEDHEVFNEVNKCQVLILRMLSNQKQSRSTPELSQCCAESTFSGNAN